MENIIYLLNSENLTQQYIVLSILTDAIAILACKELLLNMGLLMCICDYNFSLN
jgi:hypothetical protein